MQTEHLNLTCGHFISHVNSLHVYFVTVNVHRKGILVIPSEEIRDKAVQISRLVFTYNVSAY